MKTPDNADRVYAVHYPYCLKKQPDGKYVVYNREHSPIGFMARAHVDLSKVSYHINITPEIARSLSYNQSEDTQAIYLYNQATDPAKGDDFRAEYMERLMVLFGLLVW